MAAAAVFFALPLALTAEGSTWSVWVSRSKAVRRPWKWRLPAMAVKVWSLMRLPVKRINSEGLGELAFEAGRGDFERVVGSGDEVFDVEDGAEVAGELLTVLVGDAGESFRRYAARKDGDGLGWVERVAGLPRLWLVR